MKFCSGLIEVVHGYSPNFVVISLYSFVSVGKSSLNGKLPLSPRYISPLPAGAPVTKFIKVSGILSRCES